MVSEAKARPSALLQRVLAGEDIAIRRRGRPEVLLTRARQEHEPRTLGTCAGPLVLAGDFDDPIDPESLVAHSP